MTIVDCHLGLEDISLENDDFAERIPHETFALLRREALEAQVMLEALVKRVADVNLTGPPARVAPASATRSSACRYG
jgi:hypothetical protein